MVQIETVLPYIGGMESCIGGRFENQDSCGYCETDYGLLVVVCDGMGGGPSGKLASSMATNAIVQYVKTVLPTSERPLIAASILKDAVKNANKVVYTYGKENVEYQGMGTTVVAMLINKECATIAHIGDSRCYQMRRGKIVFKTQDHSVVADLVRAGNLTEEQARLSPNSNVITRSLGIKENVKVEIDILPYEKKDRFYLCTDGVWGVMPEMDLKKQFFRYPNITNILASTAFLVDELGAKNGNHHDNHTLLIVETKIKSKLIAKMSTRVKLLMLILTGLLFVSLLINFIAVFKRENIVSENYTIAAKDSIIKVLKNENSRLEKELKNIEYSYTDSIASIKDNITILEKENDELLKRNQTIEEEQKKNNKNKEKSQQAPKVLSQRMRLLFYGNEKGKQTLIDDWNFIRTGNAGEKKKRIENAIQRITPLKDEFKKLGEEKNYNKILNLFRNYDKGDTGELEKIVNEIKNKYK